MGLYKSLFLFLTLAHLYSCIGRSKPIYTEENLNDTTNHKIEIAEVEIIKELSADDIIIIKDLKFDNYTLEDEYPYKDTTRIFQWNKVKKHLAFIENRQREKAIWGVISNYKNQNKESPLVYNFIRNEYSRVSDTLGVERYQSAPLFLLGDTIQPIRYGRDGWLVKIETPDTLEMVQVEGISFEGKYHIPKRYLIPWGDTVYFNKAIFVDVTNQNIATLEKTDLAWTVRSMNPCTTGRKKPPYAQNTPVGLFAIQEKKHKMYYFHDGTRDLAGYAPYASRFTNGAYIHGVPTSDIEAPIIEYSYSLGTTPRSHMCVRNASSHSKFVYEWAKTKESVVFVID